MKSLDIYLAYSYFPHTTGIYYERALERLGHRVHYVGTPHADNFGWYETSTAEVTPRPGFPINVDITKLVEMGMPNPDLVLYIDGPLPCFPRGLAEVDAPTAGYLIDVHRKLPLESAMAPFFDQVFVCHRDFVSHFEKTVDPSDVHWLPVACDPEIHKRRETEIEFDVGFVGNVMGEPERVRRLELLESRFKMNDWRKTRPKEEIAEIYSRSRVVFNTTVAGDLNMRVFEALASGATLVTERIDNGQQELFEDGVHLLEYGDDEEMIEKIQWCLDHEEEASEIGRTGRKLVLEEHTYDRRCEKLIDLTLANKGKAPVRSYSGQQIHLSYGHVYSMMRTVDSVLDEVEKSGVFRGRLRVGVEAILAFLRRINSLTGATTFVRRLFDRRS